MFGPDTLASLTRKLVLAEREPNNPDYKVSIQELARVLALQAPNLPDPVRQRLANIGAGVARPAGRRSEGADDLLTDLRALYSFDILKQKLTDEYQAKSGTERRRITPPGEAARELVQQMYFPNLSLVGVANRLTKIRKRYA